MLFVIFMYLSEFCNLLYINYVLYYLWIWNGGKGGGFGFFFFKIIENMY